jgi:hypothetical protein
METYVVRVWVPASAGEAGATDDADRGLRGVVEHPRSGLQREFTSLEDLGELLRQPEGHTP